MNSRDLQDAREVAKAEALGHRFAGMAEALATPEPLPLTFGELVRRAFWRRRPVRGRVFDQERDG